MQATRFRSNVLNNLHALIGKQTESYVQLEVGAAKALSILNCLFSAPERLRDV